MADKGERCGSEMWHKGDSIRGARGQDIYGKLVITNNDNKAN